VVPGENLVDAQPGFDQRTNEPIISFRFDQSGARRFGRFTQDNVGRPFAIVLDDKVLSAPVIREPILGGSGQISGSFTVESANTLAVQLRSGALPVKLTIVEERTVGPSLGADSVAAGKLAALVGGVATIAFMTIAYGTFGIFAVLALIMNGMMVIALMSAIGTTLTLPGIAGLVLTVGMAVDANVIIYERIREEIRAGKSAVSAIDAGFSRAITTILDSQLTTFAAAVIMFWLGSGPIRGFAVTLSIGIFTSIFTAITVTRLLVALWLRGERAKPGRIEVPI
jgi:preprotein translocase subunit SecD